MELIQARTLQGLTQSQLSTKCGVSLSAIKSYESGRNLPGARELRELCQALEISPNKLLFGSEAPFKERSYANLLLDAEGEDEHVSRARSTILLGLMASDERNAVLTLLRSLAIARHGEAKVKEALIAADLFAGMGREFARMTRDSVIKKEPVDTSDTGQKLEEFMVRQGHKEDPKKLP